MWSITITGSGRALLLFQLHAKLLALRVAKGSRSVRIGRRFQTNLHPPGGKRSQAQRLFTTDADFPDQKKEKDEDARG